MHLYDFPSVGGEISPPQRFQPTPVLSSQRLIHSIKGSGNPGKIHFHPHPPAATENATFISLRSINETVICYSWLEKSYKEVTRELHGLERPWAPAGLPGGWRDSGESSQTTGLVIPSRLRGISNAPPRRWIGSGCRGVSNTPLGVEAMDWKASELEFSPPSLLSDFLLQTIASTPGGAFEIPRST